MQQVNILVVDDDVSLSEEVAEVLCEQGFSVTFARTSLQFEKRTKEQRFDLYVVDLLLPDGHGHDVIRRIRRSSLAGIVVLSGKMDEIDKVVSFELGADDYVVKPFARSEFVARLKSLLRRIEARSALNSERAEEPTVIEFEGLCTDTKIRKVFDASGKQVQLTKLEFDLWLALLRGRDRVLTREQLILSIRGRNWAGYDRSIDGLVSRLRKKVSNCSDVESHFETVRGVGYLLRS